MFQNPMTHFCVVEGDSREQVVPLTYIKQLVSQAFGYHVVYFKIVLSKLSLTFDLDSATQACDCCR